MSNYSGKRIVLFKNRVGPSVKFNNSLLNTLQSVHSKYNRTCQFVLSKEVLDTITKEDIYDSSIFMFQKLMTFHIHSPMNINLTSNNKVVVSNSIKILNRILSCIEKLDATCVVHCGSVGTNEQTIDNINSVNNNGWMLLENSAGAGSQLGSTIEDLSYIMSNIVRPNTGLCIDTQHAYAAGITKWDSYDESIQILDVYNNIGQIKLIHLNDSKSIFGSRIDSHEIVGKGYIWSDNNNYEGLAGIISWCTHHNVDIVEETNDSNDSISFIKYIRDMYL